jgi:hypothetical protein
MLCGFVKSRLCEVDVFARSCQQHAISSLQSKHAAEHHWNTRTPCMVPGCLASENHELRVLRVLSCMCGGSLL